MKKKLILLGVSATVIMSGCSAQKINFEGKKRTTSNIGETLENRLEKENPGMDIDVDVYLDTDKKKKKKKR